MSIDLRCGDWRTVLAGEECDALICDPPYGARTHAITVTAASRNDGCSVENIGPSFAAWSAEDVHAFVKEWHPRCRGWMACMTDSELMPHWRAAYESTGRCTFAPVVCVMRGMSVRLAGDGPSNWTVYLMVARPRSRSFATWGTLDGAYIGPRGMEAGGGRGKPSWLMSAIIRDYTRPGDLVVDPLAGWGTTLFAAASLGRRGLGSEIDRDVFNEAQRRLRRPQQQDLFA